MTACDEPDTPHISLDKAAQAKALETELGEQLVSPLSQSHIAAIVNPEMNGWFALDGSEINDNGCIPLGEELDNVTVAAAKAICCGASSTTVGCCSPTYTFSGVRPASS